MEELYWKIMGGMCIFIFVMWLREKYKFMKKNHELEKELAERRKKVAGKYPTWSNKKYK